MELTERSDQVGLLEQRLAGLLRPVDPLAEDRPVTVLTGCVGAGKTALLQALARRAVASGVRLLAANASRAERTVGLEVVRQLIRAAPLDADERTRLWRLLDEAALACAELADDDLDGPARITATIGGALLELAARGPIIIAVDDVHHADVPSLRCLDYLARRVSGLPVLIVLTEAPRTRPWHPEVYAELLQPARLHRIRLPLLTRDGTYQVLADRLGIPAARTVADESHRLSGGNPLLLRALADDHLAAAPRRTERPEVGEAFREAVLSCLYRCEYLVLKAARVLAVTEEPRHGTLLPQLIDVRSESSLRAIDESTSAGLIGENGLHPVVGRAVLDGMTAQERARLHRTAACLLHEDGEPPGRIARHLARTDDLSEPWMAQVLLDAGEQALLDGEVDSALRFLRRANRNCADDHVRARIRSALARAEWRLDPQAVVPHLIGVASAVRAGHLSTRLAAGPIHYLLWHGELDRALELVHHLGDRSDSNDPRSAAELLVTTGWITSLYPGVSVDRSTLALAGRNPLTIAKIKRRLQGITMVASVLQRGNVGAVERAERALATIRLDDERDMWTAVCALITMIYADRLDLAGDWCGRLEHRATANRQPTPAAMLAALDAGIAGRRGDLPRAQQMAEKALSQLSPKGWGVVIGIPLAIRLHALTLMGELDAAAACLQVPVPPRLFETPFGLHYLHARGLHALASGSPESALADFQLCGQLMTSWGLDLPALISWRTEAARALLQLGRHRQAEKLVQEELHRMSPTHLRPRAVALRVLAAAQDGRDPIPHLRSSVLLLRQCGDRSELAHSLTDLGHAYQQAGDLHQARKVTRAARTLAQECGIPSLEPGLTVARPGSSEDGVDVPIPMAGLNDTETQVAVLAAQGHTNREIAKQLFLTVSAIEQRLTRIYRKLDVNSRHELSARLRLNRPAGTPADRRGTARAHPGPDGGRPI
ncbi:AAA family ATPase [Micromonospora sp. DT233]|uniref:helix-turn-helix transcriptional regulator n=1 Tax=Micromonospora sp. DT233 TaxID=3393432 RepID=UPI003CEDBEFF